MVGNVPPAGATCGLQGSIGPDFPQYELKYFYFVDTASSCAFNVLSTGSGISPGASHVGFKRGRPVVDDERSGQTKFEDCLAIRCAVIAPCVCSAQMVVDQG